MHNRVGAHLIRCVTPSAPTAAIRNDIVQQLSGDAEHLSGSYNSPNTENHYSFIKGHQSTGCCSISVHTSHHSHQYDCNSSWRFRTGRYGPDTRFSLVRSCLCLPKHLKLNRTKPISFWHERVWAGISVSDNGRPFGSMCDCSIVILWADNQGLCRTSILLGLRFTGRYTFLSIYIT